jgi:uncharacterized protein involved in exopolysaccharide biosynthesis
VTKGARGEGALDPRPGVVDSHDSHVVTSSRDFDDDEISLLDILIVLAKHKKLIIGLPLLAAIITAGITLLMPNIYTARAVLMPPQQQQSTAAAMLGQLGALSGMAPSALGIKNPNDLYVGMLKSRTIADALIEQFDLRALYEKETMVETRAALAKNTNVTSGRDGLIVIEVDDKDPQRAADMANAYVKELEKLTSTLAVTEAAQRRLFFERQLEQAKEDLAQAEIALKETQERTGLVQMDQQGRAMIEAVATLRANIAAKEVELAAMRTYATDDNPQFRMVQQEVAGLRAELRKLERGTGPGASEFMVAPGQIPAAGLEYVRKFRELKYQETMFEMMAKQYELARIDEARDTAVIQVVDRAVAPDIKSNPKRVQLVFFAVLIAFLVILVTVFLRESIEKTRKQSHNGSVLPERV